MTYNASITQRPIPLLNKVIPHYPTDDTMIPDILKTPSAISPALPCPKYPKPAMILPRPASEINTISKNSAVNVDQRYSNPQVTQLTNAASTPSSSMKASHKLAISILKAHNKWYDESTRPPINPMSVHPK
jgi:hypothetical protein